MPKTLPPSTLTRLLLPFLLTSLALNTISQILPTLYTAENVYTHPGTVPPDATTYISQHPATTLGFWKRCEGSCGDLDLPCGKQIPSTPTTNNKDLAQSYQNTSSHLCPIFNAARVLMVLSLFAGLISTISLLLTSTKRYQNDPIARLFSVLGVLCMTVVQITALGLLIAFKSDLDTLGSLSAQLQNGSNTPVQGVNTVYAFGSGFWVVVAAVVCIVLCVPGVGVAAGRLWVRQSRIINDGKEQTKMGDSHRRYPTLQGAYTGTLYPVPQMTSLPLPPTPTTPTTSQHTSTQSSYASAPNTVLVPDDDSSSSSFSDSKNSGEEEWRRSYEVGDDNRWRRQSVH